MEAERKPALTRHAAVIITKAFGDKDLEVHIHGDLDPCRIDVALDQARRQLGTYEETPLDRFLDEQGLQLEITPNRDGTCHAFVEASIREPGTRWGLLGCSADGATPAAARRNLARGMSGGTLVRGAMYCNPAYVQIPDLVGGADLGMEQ